ncbi:MAG: GntR family transcriptional regulator [Firmicutes bacterium]|uniref:GntR family transcriptional regulator n=1 Tax=Melghirimyces thermohalophilus TaxID=1236220 RepID=A0A1G6K734_9BACL|nr:GntR family transcriptional regulator [Melghirimyces thermohalophilus]MDA8352933.1 GntR family transcriptional regulator [Bacillota bacterium]SDC26708.1 GntR family transcriptional regulator [Melghirimyces thermohalophilus]
MNIIISNRSKEPIYVQIKEQIKQSVLNQTLHPGEPLPSIRKLAKELQVSVITTKRAYEELEREGFVESVVGRGSFIAGQSEEWVREQQLKRIEDKLTEAVEEGRRIGLSLSELKEMLELIDDQTKAEG